MSRWRTKNLTSKDEYVLAVIKILEGCQIRRERYIVAVWEEEDNELFDMGGNGIDFYLSDVEKWCPLAEVEGLIDGGSE